MIAIDELTADAHAARIQQVLTELTEQGFQLVSQAQRGLALIITASRFPEAPRREEPTPPPSGSGKLSN